MKACLREVTATLLTIVLLRFELEHMVWHTFQLITMKNLFWPCMFEVADNGEIHEEIRFQYT